MILLKCNEIELTSWTENKNENVINEAEIIIKIKHKTKNKIKMIIIGVAKIPAFGSVYKKINNRL